jgi:hypothetical protein
MSLAVLADHMASKGRGPDSMLIHMSPREVQGLQALAEHHGGTLTINPETGLPEANFLEKLLPTIIGAGISFFSQGTIDPMTAAAMVGGVETARTGDIGRGISAGFQAYGGANLTAGLTEAGASTIGAAEAASGLTMSPELLAEFGGDSARDALLQQQVTDRMAAATPFEKLSSGFDAIKNNPMGMAKSLAMPAAMAFGPAILAGANVKSNMPQTVTKPGMITPYNYFGGQYVAGAPYQASPTKAAGGGLMGMNDGGYNPGQLDFTQRSEPVVRMAEGGKVERFANGMLVGDQDVFNYFKGLDQAKLASGALDAQIAADMQKYNVGAADIGRITGTQANQGNFEQRFVQAVNPATMSAQQFLDVTADVGLKDQALANAMKNAGMSQAAQYAATHQLNDAAGIVGAPTSAQNLYNSIGYKAGDLKGDTGGLAGMYANISGVAGSLQDKINSGALTVAQAQNLSLAEMDRLGINQADIKGATGKDFGNLFTAKVVPPTCGFGMQLNKAGTACEQIICGTGFQLNKAGTACEAIVTTKDTIVGGGGNDTIVTKKCEDGYHLSADGKSCIPNAPVIIDYKDCGTGYHWDKAKQVCVANINVTQNTTTNVTTPTSLTTTAANTLPVGVSGNTGASIIGGGSTVNPNGTITTSPVIPGIPVGGFTGMEQLRDTYEKGGGSLGVNKNIFVPKTYKEVEDRFKLTGGSKQAYDYLTGKTKYSPTPYTEDGQIAKSYAESVMKIPVASSSKMYIFKNGRYEINPDYAIPTYDKDGKKSSNLTNADVKTFMDKSPSPDAFYTWATTNNLSPEQVALASDRPINEISKLFTGAKDLVGEDGKIDQTKVDEKAEADFKTNFDYAAYLKANPDVQAELDAGKANFGTKDDLAAAAYEHYQRYGKAQKRPLKAAGGGLMNMAMARGGMSQQFDLGGYSDGGRLLRGPGDGVSDSIPATIGGKRPARLADGEFVVPARIVSELGNGSTEAGARKLYAMMNRVQAARRGTVGKGRVAKNSRSDKYLPA